MTLPISSSAVDLAALRDYAGQALSRRTELADLHNAGVSTFFSIGFAHTALQNAMDAGFALSRSDAEQVVPGLDPTGEMPNGAASNFVVGLTGAKGYFERAMSDNQNNAFGGVVSAWNAVRPVVALADDPRSQIRGFPRDRLADDLERIGNSLGLLHDAHGIARATVRERRALYEGAVDAHRATVDAYEKGAWQNGLSKAQLDRSLAALNKGLATS